MKHALILGAGLVARPLIRYLLNESDVHVTVADLVLSKAEEMIGDHPRGAAIQLSVEDADAVRKAIEPADIVVSLVPWIYHIQVARLCLELNKHLVTASYVKPEMQALDAEVKKRGLLFLNEIGVDPGIDHMAAMRVINGVKSRGGRIDSFYSYCGGLPAMESNTNPFGYKFSWSPVGVMLAANNDGRYKKDGTIIEVPGAQLFKHYWLLDVPGSGTFEAYVNRDAIPYLDVYGIQDACSIYRGTLRNISHCESWNYYKKLGLLTRENSFDFSALTLRQVMALLVNGDEQTVVADAARFLNIPLHAVALKKLEWLGLFSEEKLPIGTASSFDMFALMLQEKLVYSENEIDLLVQHHEFIADYPDGRKEKITSTMVDTGIRGGDSSMARTVSLPVAIATKMILNGGINLTGVHIPVLPEIYEPVLNELEAMNISLVERKRII